MSLKQDQFIVSFLCQIDRRPLRIAVNDFEDAAVGTVGDGRIGVMAAVFVIPINQENRAVLIFLHVQDLRP